MWCDDGDMCATRCTAISKSFSNNNWRINANALFWESGTQSWPSASGQMFFKLMFYWFARFLQKQEHLIWLKPQLLQLGYLTFLKFSQVSQPFSKAHWAAGSRLSSITCVCVCTSRDRTQTPFLACRAFGCEGFLWLGIWPQSRHTADARQTQQSQVDAKSSQTRFQDK